MYRQRGRYAEAVRYHDKAREVAANVPDADLRTQLYLDRGATALARGARQEALTAGKSALDLADGSGNRAYRARAHRGVAETLHAMGDHEGAVTHWAAAEAEFAALDLPEAGEVREDARRSGVPAARGSGRRECGGKAATHGRTVSRARGCRRWCPSASG